MGGQKVLEERLDVGDSECRVLSQTGGQTRETVSWNFVSTEGHSPRAIPYVQGNTKGAGVQR